MVFICSFKRETMLIQTELISIRDERHLKSFTGVNLKQYQMLHSELDGLLGEKQAARLKEQTEPGKRRRRPGGGRKNKLPTTDDKLLFVLHYHKAYPTMDNIASEFRMCRSTACDHVHALSGHLKECLERMGVLPKRRLESPGALMAYLKELGDIDKLLVDVTERAYRRLEGKEERDALYSGKKKGSP